MAHGDAREGKWRGNWRMEWVASTLTLPQNMVYPALLPLMRTPRLPVFDWTNAPADLNGLFRFAGRPNLVSARVSSHFKRSLHLLHQRLHGAKNFGVHVGPMSFNAASCFRGLIITHLDTIQFRIYLGGLSYDRLTSDSHHMHNWNKNA